MVRVQNKHWSPNTHKPPADSKIYRPRSPPLAWSSTPVSTKSSCTRHLHLQPEGSGMVETTWSPSHAMEWRPRQRLKTAGDNIDGGFQHRPRTFPLEINHCCSCRLHGLVARDLVSEWVSEWVTCATVSDFIFLRARVYHVEGMTTYVTTIIIAHQATRYWRGCGAKDFIITYVTHHAVMPMHP